MKHICIAVMLSAAALFAAAERPNIVFILTDDQGYGDVARHGHPYLETPHLDRLHDESVLLRQSFLLADPCGADGRNAPRGSGPPAAVVECTQAGFVKMEAD
jgi:hypothetical protein